MKKRFLPAFLACALALVMVLSLFPLPSMSVKADLPDPFYTPDRLKIREFLETTDADGVRNGTKLNEDYDPDDPWTWTGFNWYLYTNVYYLKKVDISGDLVGKLDLSESPKLEYCFINGTQMTEANISGCPILDWVSVTGNSSLKKLDVSDNPVMDNLDAYENALTEIDFSGCPKLWIVELYLNELTSLDFTGFDRLYDLDCSRNKLTELVLTGCTSMGYLDCSFNELTELELPPNPGFESLSCSHNKLTKLDFTPYPELWGFDCSSNEITKLDLSNNPILNGIDCSDNKLTELDLSGCPNIDEYEALEVSGNRFKKLVLPDNGVWPVKTVTAGNGGTFEFIKDKDWVYVAEDNDYVWVYTFYVTAYCDSGYDFFGWYGAGGRLTNEEKYDCTSCGEDTLTAKFGIVPYNSAELGKLRAFMETADEDGVKNGDKLSDNYDKNDPATWGTCFGVVYTPGQPNSWGTVPRFQFVNVNGEKRLYIADVSGVGAVGEIDVSGFTSLEELKCSDNGITAVNAAGCTALELIDCSYNPLTSLDVSGCTALWDIDCWRVKLTEIDLSDCPGFGLNSIKAEEGGTFGFDLDFVLAYPDEGYEYAGWYSADGELLFAPEDGTPYMDSISMMASDIVAKFTRTVTPGDVTGDGEISVLDAVAALRGAMGITELTEAQAAAADFNGDGDVTILDAVMILRKAMGII